jgi:Beta propeller domain
MKATPEPYVQCATLRRIETADIVRVEGDRVYALNDADELSVFDIGDIDWPRRLGVVRLDGDAMALFVRSGVALVALTEADTAQSSGRSRLLAIDLRDPAHPVPLGTERLSGSIRDVHAVDDALYFVGEDGATGASSVVVTSFTFSGAGLRRAGELRLPGRDPSFVVGATKLAVAFNGAGAGGVESAKVVVADTGTDPSGPFVAAGEVTLRGAVAPRVEATLDEEERFVQVVGCGSRDCAAGELLLLSAIDVTDPYAPREVSEQGLPPLEGPPVSAFAGDRLYLAGGRGFAPGEVTTRIQVVDLREATRPVLAPPLVVPGSVAAFIPTGDRVLTVGYRMREPRAMHVQISELDIESAGRPRLVGALEFGEEFTSSFAASEPRAAAVAEQGQWTALPFRTWHPHRREPASGVALLRTGTATLRLTAALPADGWIERVLFLRDRVIAVGDSSLTVMTYEDVEHPEVLRPGRAPEGLHPVL